jgi:hypothetical protein
MFWLVPARPKVFSNRINEVLSEGEGQGRREKGERRRGNGREKVSAHVRRGGARARKSEE